MFHGLPSGPVTVGGWCGGPLHRVRDGISCAFGFPVGPGQIIKHVRDGWGLGPLFRYLKAGAKREPWLEVHTESRWLRGFNEEGWNDAWATAAEICRTRPELAGMIGSSWFYDPPLTEISPRLAHLRLNPLKGGAFMVHQGPGEIHTQRAATASASRKALIHLRMR